MPDKPADDASADPAAGAEPGPDGDAGRAGDGDALSRGQARDALHNAALEVMAEHLRCDARSWAA